MTFADYLKSKDIPFNEHVTEAGGKTLYVDDRLLYPYEQEVRELFPQFKFVKDIVPHGNDEADTN